MPRTYGISNAAPWATAPAVGLAGDIYYNTTNKRFYTSDGTAWTSVGASSGDILDSGYQEYAATGSTTLGVVDLLTFNINTQSMPTRLFITAQVGAGDDGGVASYTFDFQRLRDSAVFMGLASSRTPTTGAWDYSPLAWSYDNTTGQIPSFKVRANRIARVGTLYVQANVHWLLVATGVPAAPGGTKIPWTPVLRQTNPVACTIAIADLTRIGDRVSGEVHLNITGSGAATTTVLDWPFGWKPATTVNQMLGYGYIQAPSVVPYFPLGGSSGMTFYGNNGSPFATALANGHVFSMQFSYISST